MEGGSSTEPAAAQLAEQPVTAVPGGLDDGDSGSRPFGRSDSYRDMAPDANGDGHAAEGGKLNGAPNGHTPEDSSVDPAGRSDSYSVALTGYAKPVIGEFPNTWAAIDPRSSMAVPRGAPSNKDPFPRRFARAIGVLDYRPGHTHPLDRRFCKEGK